MLAVFGELRPSAAKALGLRQRAAVAEVFVDAVPARRRPRAKTPAAAARRLQPVRRDFAFVMEAEAGAESLLRAVAAAAPEAIASVRLFDVYEGPELGDAKRGYAVEVVFQPGARSFTDAELEALSAKVVAKAASATGAVLRGA